MTDDQIRRAIWNCKWMAYGVAPTDVDYNYWAPMWPGLVARGVEINHPNYAEDRCLGWTSGEPIADADRAKFGPYAVPQTPYHDVPPYPGAVAPPVVTPPATDPTQPSVPDMDLAVRLGQFETLLGEIAVKQTAMDAKIDTFIAKGSTPAAVVFPDYQGSGRIPLIGNVNFTLTPKKP